MIKKVDVGQVDIKNLKELEPLLINKTKEYIVVGKSVYELYPTQALVLLEVVSDIFEILQRSKSYKYEKLKLADPETWSKLGEDSVILTISDVVSVQENIEAIKKVLRVLLDGVDEEDFNLMTVQQIVQILGKLVKVNIESFPESFKQNFKQLLNSQASVSDVAEKVSDSIKKLQEMENVNTGEKQEGKE